MMQVNDRPTDVTPQQQKAARLNWQRRVSLLIAVLSLCALVVLGLVYVLVPLEAWEGWLIGVALVLTAFVCIGALVIGVQR